MFKLLLALALVSLSYQSCSSEDKAHMGKCIPLFSETASLFKQQRITLSDDPEELKELIASCRKSLDCAANIKCEEFTTKLAVPKQSCENIEMATNVFPCLVNIVTSRSTFRDKYPCTKSFSDDMKSAEFKCKLFGANGWDCAGPIIKDVCGEDAFISFDRLKQPFIESLKCASTSS